MASIKFIGIGEEGYCDRCGRELKETYHFVVDGEKVVVGSSCASKVSGTFTAKKMKEVVKTSDRLERLKRELVILSKPCVWLDFLPDVANVNNEITRLENKKNKINLIADVEKELSFEV